MDNVSIIIPSRKLDSILKNTLIEIRKLYKDVTVILVLDDISDFDSIDINNIRIIKSESKNMSAKRNQGADCAESEYIAFIDSDAYPCIDWLENGVSFLEKNKEYSAVTGLQFNAKDDNFEQRCLRLLRFSPLFTRKEWTKINNIYSVNCDVSEFMTSNVIMRKNDFLSAGGFDKNIYLAEDNEFSERFVNSGFKIRFNKNVMVYHRESTLIPFLRKLFCQGYYYSNVLINSGYPESAKAYFKKNALSNIFPLLLVVLYIICLVISLIYNKYFFELLLIPCFVLLLILLMSFYLAKKHNSNFFKTSLFIFMYSLLYVLSYVSGLLFGLLNIPIKIYDYYKHL